MINTAEVSPICLDITADRKLEPPLGHKHCSGKAVTSTSHSSAHSSAHRSSGGASWSQDFWHCTTLTLTSGQHAHLLSALIHCPVGDTSLSCPHLQLAPRGQLTPHIKQEGRNRQKAPGPRE
ncbi:hypothetical protein GN956_G5759 [Arapaima gigas]